MALLWNRLKWLYPCRWPALPQVLSFTRSTSAMTATPYTEAWLQGPQSTQFYTRSYAPSTGAAPNAAVVFVHGFAEHIARYAHFHPLLAERDIAVFAFDQRGFGLTAQDTKGNKSKTSSYGKTCWKDQMEDINWAVGYAKKTWEGVPVILMGHSMGGGEALGFATQPDGSPSQSTISSLSGVVATSPLIEQTKPAPPLLRRIGGIASRLAPYTLIPADVDPKELSHDLTVGEAYMKDPLVKQQGSLKGISDMLSNGEALLSTYYKNWPQKLPILVIHGTADQVTNYKASQAFIDKIVATNKNISLYTDGFHELQNEPDGVKEKLATEVADWIDSIVATSPATAAKM